MPTIFLPKLRGSQHSCVWLFWLPAILCFSCTFWLFIYILQHQFQRNNLIKVNFFEQCWVWSYKTSPQTKRQVLSLFSTSFLATFTFWTIFISLTILTLWNNLLLYDTPRHLCLYSNICTLLGDQSDHIWLGDRNQLIQIDTDEGFLSEDIITKKRAMNCALRASQNI